MSHLALVRVGVPVGTEPAEVWETVTRQPAMRNLAGGRLYRPTRGVFEPTEWIVCGDLPEPLGAIDLPGDRLPLRKADSYPFRGEINPTDGPILGSSLPMQLVTITVVEPKIAEFEDWYGAHADMLSRAVGASGARRYWQDGAPRRYASLYYYTDEPGIEQYLTSDTRAAASQDRLRFDPWLVDQHHAYYTDVTPA